MSSITFAGNLAADPELRFTPSGRAVARFTVIENRRRRTEDGQGWEDAEPNVFRVQVWGSFAENVVESCGKGDRVHVTGSIVTDRWMDKETREDRTAQHVKADEVSFSLRYHTVRATKATRSNSQAQEAEDTHEG
jgi:single-strand DNA-binding protein